MPPRPRASEVASSHSQDKIKDRRRQVTKRPYVLSSQPAENGQEIPAKTETRLPVPRAKVRVTPKKQRRYNGDLSQSSPLVPLDENYQSEPHSEDMSERSSPSKESVTKGSVLSTSERQSKDAQNIQETPPAPPIEFSYLSSTPLPGKQQLRRQRPFTAAREVNQSENTSSSSRQTRSSGKVSKQEHPSLNHSTQKCSSVKASQPIKPFKANSLSGSREKDMDSSNESPTGSGGRRKKNHGSTHRDSAVSVDRLTKALSERRLLKRREKQNPPPKKESRKNSYLRAEKEKENVSRSNTASSRLQQSSSLPKDSLQNESFGASENSDTSSDIENQNMQKKKSKNKSSVDQLRRPVTKQIHYEENKIDQSRAEVEAEKSSSKILTNKITTKNKLTIQNENKNSTKKIGTKSDKESGSSKSKSQMNNVAEGIQRREAKRKPGKDSHKRKARRKSSESESEVESEEELATCKKQQNVSKNSAVSSARKKRRLSSSCESDDESQNENIPTQKRSGNVKQMKHQREALKIKKRDKDSSSVRQNSHVSSDSENETQNRKTTLREPLNKEKQTTSKMNNKNTVERKQAADTIPKKKARFNSTDNDDIGPDQTMMVWGSDDMKRKKGDIVDVDVVLNCFSEVLESQVDICETDTEQRAIRTLDKYLTQDITGMIRNVQNVNSLQKQVRKKEQELKQKKSHLISLQDRRLELEEKGSTAREQTNRNNNIKEINSFIQDLQELIGIC